MFPCNNKDSIQSNNIKLYRMVQWLASQICLSVITYHALVTINVPVVNTWTTNVTLIAQYWLLFVGQIRVWLSRIVSFTIAWEYFNYNKKKFSILCINTVTCGSLFCHILGQYMAILSILWCMGHCVTDICSQWSWSKSQSKCYTCCCIQTIL